MSAKAMNPAMVSIVLRSASMALACIEREYPAGSAHIVRSRSDVLTHRDLHPAFYGCFDWHSAVENHWQLVRIARLYPHLPIVKRIAGVLSLHLTTSNLRREADYFSVKTRSGFERPYGLAWVLQLAAELFQWDTPLGERYARAFRPLCDAAVASLVSWLPRLSHPIRSGVHSQTAFSMGFALDYARTVGDRRFARILENSAVRFYARDRGVPIAFEPSGHDFLSPSLAEADLMRRVLAPRRFAEWLTRLLPAGVPLKPAAVSDRSDGQLAHFAGLNLSRAWMLRGIAAGLPRGDVRIARLRTLALAHRRAGLASLSWRGYMTTHWLGAYAIYLETCSGERVVG